MPESVQSCFELSIHFPVFFSRELFLEQFTAGSLYRQMYGARDQSLESSQSDWSTKFCKLFLRVANHVPRVFRLFGQRGNAGKI